MRINNYLLSFVGILTILTVSHFFIIYKYFQVLIHRSIYYCQEMAKVLTLGLPGHVGKAAFILLALASMSTIIRLFVTFYKIYSFRRSLRETKARREITFTQILQKLDLRDKVKIIQQEKLQAFCFGFLHPKIYISTGLIRLMNKKELEVILRHERYHLENRDPLTMLLATFVGSLFPFFPILSDFIRIYRIDREVKADRAAINQTSDAKSLALVLRKLLKYEPVSPAFVTGIISANTLESRIQSLLSLRTSYQTISRRNLFISIISFIALVLLIVTPVNAVELHEEGHDVVMLCRETTACKSVCRSKLLYTPANLTSAN